MSTTNKKPRSEAQAAQSRVNGAKSKGAITPQGKSVTSKNRMTHGFRSNSITLSAEDHVAYDQHLDAYLARYSPVDKIEEDLVGLLASNMWQVMRNNAIEVALFNLEISGVDDDYLEDRFETVDEYGRLAIAFRRSAGDNAFEVLRRYRSTAERAYHRALQALERIKGNRTQAVPEPQQPDPSENLFTVLTREEPVAEPLHAPHQPREPRREAIGDSRIAAPAADPGQPRLLLVSNHSKPAGPESRTSEDSKSKPQSRS